MYTLTKKMNWYCSNCMSSSNHQDASVVMVVSGSGSILLMAMSEPIQSTHIHFSWTEKEGKKLTCCLNGQINQMVSVYKLSVNY